MGYCALESSFTKAFDCPVIDIRSFNLDFQAGEHYFGFLCIILTIIVFGKDSETGQTRVNCKVYFYSDPGNALFKCNNVICPSVFVSITDFLLNFVRLQMIIHFK